MTSTEAGAGGSGHRGLPLAVTVGRPMGDGAGYPHDCLEASLDDGDARGVVAPVDFDTFFRASFRRIVAASAPLVGSFTEAEDVAQEAFAAAARHWSRVSTYEDPEGWVRRVAYNRAVSLTRSAARRARAYSRQPNPVPSDEYELESLALFMAMRRLPMRYREVLALHYLADRSLAQIAEELGRPYATVRSQLTRGRSRLLQLLSDDEVPAEGDGADD